MQSRLYNGFVLASIWLGLCIAIFIGIDTYATRGVAINVESYRRVGMSDVEAVGKAIEVAHEIRSNPWWIHDKRPFLVFDPQRDYNLDDVYFTHYDLELKVDDLDRHIGILHPVALMR